jgi:hypothetical protein
MFQNTIKNIFVKESSDESLDLLERLLKAGLKPTKINVIKYVLDLVVRIIDDDPDNLSNIETLILCVFKKFTHYGIYFSFKFFFATSDYGVVSTVLPRVGTYILDNYSATIIQAVYRGYKFRKMFQYQ